MRCCGSDRDSRIANSPSVKKDVVYKKSNFSKTITSGIRSDMNKLAFL